MTGQAPQVLVVEDQELWREQFFGESLQELGFKVFAAATKEEALALLDRHTFTLAIIDINLTQVPGNTDGLVVANYINRRGLKLPIIVVSGSEEGMRLLGSRQNLVMAEIKKDKFDLNEFIAQVKQAAARFNDGGNSS